MNQRCRFVATNLSSNQRLLFGSIGDLGDLLRSRLLSWGRRELGGSLLGALGLSGNGGRATVAAEHLLDLASVVASVLLAHGSELIGLLLSNAANLGSLGVDGLGSILDLLVNELLVGGVDKRNQESYSGADNSETPVGDELDEEVGEESCNTGGGRGEDVLGEKNTLGLNDKEVEKLVDVSDQAVEGFARNGVVSAGAELRSETVVKDKLSGSFSGDGNGQSHPRKLESPANNIEITSGDDGGDDGSVRNTRGTCGHAELAHGLFIG